MSKKSTVIVLVFTLVVCVSIIGVCVFMLTKTVHVTDKNTEVSEQTEEETSEQYELPDPNAGLSEEILAEDGTNIELDTTYMGMEDSGEWTEELSNPDDLLSDCSDVAAYESMLGYAELVPAGTIDFVPGSKLVYLGCTPDHTQYFFTSDDLACNTVSVMDFTYGVWGPNGEQITREEATARIGGN